MAAKKRSKARKSVKGSDSANKKFNLAWSNFSMFLILFIISFLLYSFSTNALFINFFGILSTILGFLAFAFLLVLIILGILKSKKGKKR